MLILYLVRLIVDDKCGLARRLNGTMYPWGIFRACHYEGTKVYNYGASEYSPLCHPAANGR